MRVQLEHLEKVWEGRVVTLFHKVTRLSQKKLASSLGKVWEVKRVRWNFC